jgi:GT2 family glycosyltransferase
MDNPELSIIIVSYNVCHLLLECIQSVIDTTIGINYEAIVVDNASVDRSVDAVKKTFLQVRAISNHENVGFARANNQGYELSKGQFILLLNPDTVVKSGAIRAILEFMKTRHDAGMAACRLLNPDGSLQRSIRPFPTIKEHLSRALFIDRIFYREYWKKTYYQSAPFEIDYCTGAFMMVRRKALGDMPLLNSEFFMYAEEKDLALRLKKNGWKTYFVPSQEIIHFGEQSTGQMVKDMFLELQKSQLRFFGEHYRGLNKILMIWTYWAILCSDTIASSFIPFTKHNRLRLRLFWAATIRYFSMIKYSNAPKP